MAVLWLLFGSVIFEGWYVYNSNNPLTVIVSITDLFVLMFAAIIWFVIGIFTRMI